MRNSKLGRRFRLMESVQAELDKAEITGESREEVLKILRLFPNSWIQYRPDAPYEDEHLELNTKNLRMKIDLHY